MNRLPTLLRRCASAAGAALLSAVCLWGPLAPAALASAGAPSPTPAPIVGLAHPGRVGYADLRLLPGATTTVVFTVTNPGNVPATFLPYAVGATTSDTSGVSYGERGSRPLGPNDLVRWLSLPESRITVGPHMTVDFPVRVSVPAQVDAGDYVGGLAVDAPVGTQAGQGSHAKVRILTTTRSVVAIVVHVAGPTLTGFAVGRPATGYAGESALIYVPMASTGNRLTKPTAKLSWRPCTGGPTTTARRSLDTFVPHTRIKYPWSLSVPPAGDCAIVSVSVWGSGARPSTWTGALHWSTPPSTFYGSAGASHAVQTLRRATDPGVVWDVAAVIFLLQALLFLLILFWRRRRARQDLEEHLQGRIADLERQLLCGDSIPAPRETAETRQRAPGPRSR